jgi:hypothetical protein
MAGKITYVGIIAIGAADLAACFLSNGPPPTGPLLGGFAMIGMGAYYLFTGKQEASLKDYILGNPPSEGKQAGEPKGPPAN